MPTYSEMKASIKERFGFRVDRATATLPASTTGNIFTIAGGRVAVTQLIGEVTVDIQNQACNLHITSVPTAGPTVNISADGNIQNLLTGGFVGISGLNTDATIAIGGALPGQDRDVILPIGSIQIHTSATNSGSIKWTLFYVPVDVGAYVSAA